MNKVNILLYMPKQFLRLIKFIKNFINKNRSLSLAILLYILYSIIFILVRKEQAKKIQLKHVMDNLLIGAKSVQYIIEENFHSKYTNTCPISIDNYNIRRLTEFARINNIRFIYSYTLNEKHQVYFTSSSLNINETLEKPEVRFGFIFDEATPALKKAFRKPGMYFEKAEDRWGKFFAVYWTVKENNKTWIAGAELRRELYDQEINKALQIAIFDLLSTTLASTLVALIIFGTLLKKISRLNEENRSQRRLLTIMSNRR